MKPSNKYAAEMYMEAMKTSDPEQQLKNLRKMNNTINTQRFGNDVTATRSAFMDEAVQKALFSPASNLTHHEAFAALEYAGITSIEWSEDLNTEFMKWQFNITTGE